MAGIGTNSFHFQGAIKILHEELAPRLKTRLKLEENDFGPLIDPTLGKCYSALGQNYAFLKRYRDALEAFQKSLEHFVNNSGNIEITVTHVLHLALAMEDMDLFEYYASDFFNDSVANNTISRHGEGSSIPPLADGRGKVGFPLLEHRWRNAMKSHNPFKLLVLLKAINLMELWKRAGMLERILNADYSAHFASDDSHPWEFIYRHMAEMAFKAGYSKPGQALIKKSIAVAAPGLSLTFKVLHLGTRMMADSYLYQGKKLAACYREKIEELIQVCLSAPEAAKYIYSQDNPNSWFYDCVINADSNFSPHKKVKMFLERFTYAYR
jgi:tetratricopeptide (TPR) repeat protein